MYKMNKLIAYFTSFQTETFNLAIKEGNNEIVDRLLRRGISKYVDVTESLQVASQQQYINIEVISTLLKYGAIIKDQTIKNICKKRKHDVCKMFILSRNNHNGDNFPFEHLLCLMCQRNETELVTLLLKEGAIVDIMHGYPLLFAVYHNNFEMTQNLLKRGANPNIFFPGRKEFSITGLAQLPNSNELIKKAIDLSLLNENICILDYYTTKPEIIDLIKNLQ